LTKYNQFAVYQNEIIQGIALVAGGGDDGLWLISSKKFILLRWFM
jgi:hypothetical protein